MPFHELKNVGDLYSGKWKNKIVKLSFKLREWL